MPTVRLGSSIWDTDSSDLRRDGSWVALSPLERRLVGYLAERAGQTVGSEELLQNVWEYKPGVRTRAVANTVARLRTKLGDDAGSIVTVFGRGYRLETSGDRDLVGRDALLEQVSQVLERTRWVTLYGLGGVGKTRVTRAVSQQQGRRTLWVPCDGMRTESDLWSALADMLNMSASVEPERIRRALGALGPLCLVLDAVEGLGETGAIVGEALIADCPELHLIVTTRVHHGEGDAIRVGPLDSESAAALFVRRVETVRKGAFDPDPQHLNTVLDLVDRLPLGIELAAARLRLFDLASLAQRMQDDLSIVDRGGTSLEAVLEQSWRLLSPDQQRVLCAAAQFAESFTLDQVAAASGLAGGRLLDALEGLVRGSFVLDRHPRFRMLNLVRSFGAAKADTSTRAAFAVLCVRAATDLWERWLRADPVPRDAPGYPIPAIGPLLETSPTPYVQACLSLGLFAHHSRYGSIARIRPILVDLTVDGLDDRLTACVRLVQAWSAYYAGAWTEAEALAREGRKAAEDAGEPGLRLRCWRLVAATGLAIGASDEALSAEVTALEEAVDSTAGVPLARARALHVCGIHRASTGRMNEAATLYQRALGLAEDDIGLSVSISGHVGYAYRQLERLDLAIDVMEEARSKAEHLVLGAQRLMLDMQLLFALGAAGRFDRADEVQSELSELARRWDERCAHVAASAYRANRIPDPHRREAALQRTVERALRDHCPENAGYGELWRGHSLHLRGELSLALTAYEAALAHLAPFGQLFAGTLAHVWCRLLQLEQGADTSVEVSLLAEPSPLEATLVTLVRAAGEGDWKGVDTIAEAATDQAVHQTVALIDRLRPPRG